MAASTEKLVTTVVAYPFQTSTSAQLEFNMEYYLSTHMPLIDKIWGQHGLLRWSIAQFPNPCPLTGQAPLYGVQTTLYWKSVDDFKAAMTDPGSQVTAKDVENFSNTMPVIWVGEVQGTQEREGVEGNMKNFTYGQAGL